MKSQKIPNGPHVAEYSARFSWDLCLSRYYYRPSQTLLLAVSHARRQEGYMNFTWGLQEACWDTIFFCWGNTRNFLWENRHIPDILLFFQKICFFSAFNAYFSPARPVSVKMWFPDLPSTTGLSKKEPLRQKILNDDANLENSWCSNAKNQLVHVRFFDKRLAR